MNSILEFIIMIVLAVIYFKWILPNCAPNMNCDLKNNLSNNNLQNKNYKTLNDSYLVKKYRYTDLNYFQPIAND
jgi:hypothetical protein